jgi:hypothetical protein
MTVFDQRGRVLEETVVKAGGKAEIQVDGRYSGVVVVR